MLNFKVHRSILKIKYFSLIIFPILFLNSSLMNRLDMLQEDFKSTPNDVSIFSIKDDPWIEQTLSKMTLEEKAGQLVFPSTIGRYMSEDSPEYHNLVQLVRDKKVGGLIFFLSDIYEQAVLTNKLQRIADIPLLIAADFERGVAMRVQNATPFPYNMAVGAADDSLLTYLMGKAIATEGRSLGVHHNYAPVADINNNAYNPIINVRSFGEDVHLVTKHSNAFLKGVQDGGMIATTKHFPGHGNTSSDSHLELPIIEGSREELNRIEFFPFQSNINNGVMSVMVGHLNVPAIDTEKIPSTLSKKIVTNLLQKEMGFKGLIITDAMNMHGVTNYFSTAEATVKAIQAGNDAILLPDDPYESIDAIVKAVKQGIISEERLNHSIRKILIAKKWLGLDKNRFVNIDDISKVVGKEEHWELARSLARKSITLVKDEQRLIPLSANDLKSYAHIQIIDSRNIEDGEYFNSMIKQRVTQIKIKKILLNSTKSDFDEAYEIASNADVVILSTYLKVRAYQGTILLPKEHDELVNSLLKLNKPIVFLSHGNPYVLSSYPEAKTYLTNYGDPVVSELALAEAIFGQIPIQGKLSVSIPNTSYKVGFGIKLERSALRNSSSISSLKEAKRFEKVDELIQKVIYDSAFPCAVLLVAKDGEILHERAFGHYTYDEFAQKISTNTIFDLASVTKVVATTSAAMICIDRNLFSLDDKVSTIIPEFAQNGKENITIRNLLLHNSGLPAWKKFYETCKTESDVLKDIYSTKIDYEPGTKTVYSDLGMITLGKVIEKVTNKSLDKFCADEIFNPLGMSNTFFNPPKSLKNKIAPTENDQYWRMRQLVGEVHDETASLMNGVAGHAGLFSTARDLSVFLQMILQKGFYQGRRIINSKTVELFTKRQSENSSRGLGWDTKPFLGSSAGDLFSELSYGHTGYTGTSVWTDPTRNLFVIFLTNRVYPTRNNTKLSEIRPKLHDAVIKAVGD